MSEEPTNSDPSSKPAPRRIPWLWISLAALVGLFALRSMMPSRGLGKLSSLSLEPLTFSGDKVALDDLKGKVVVLNFWGPWCGPCRVELPHVARLAREYADDAQCRVLAVSCGSHGPDTVASLPGLRKETADLLEASDIALRAYSDPDGRTRRAVNDAVGFRGYPTTLVLDRQGIIRRVWTGFEPGDEHAVAQLVVALLRETEA